MFPQLRERVGSALDLVVEFSTLGEYRLGADGATWPASALTPAPEHEPQLGGVGDPHAARAAVRRTVAGGAAGPAPVATPAARRLAQKRAGRSAAPGLPRSPAHAPGRVDPAPSGVRSRRAGHVPACRGERRRGGSERSSLRDMSRPGAAAVPEQLCLAL
jgi:hypothetical protein